MKIKNKINQYLKKGAIIFVYSLDCTKEEAAEFKSSQGEFYRESDKKEPLYFSQRTCPIGTELTKTRSGRFQVLSDLEQVVAEREVATNNNYGKIEAIRQFSGLSKAQMTERLLASF